MTETNGIEQRIEDKISYYIECNEQDCSASAKALRADGFIHVSELDREDIWIAACRKFKKAYNQHDETIAKSMKAAIEAIKEKVGE